MTADDLRHGSLVHPAPVGKRAETDEQILDRLWTALHIQGEAETAHEAGLSAEVIATTLGIDTATARLLLGCAHHDCG